MISCGESSYIDERFIKDLVLYVPLILHVFAIEFNIPWCQLIVVSCPLLEITRECGRIDRTVSNVP